MTGTLFEEQARWSTSSSSPVGGPLTPSSPPEAAAPGETVTLEGGATAVVRSVNPDAPPRNDFSTPEQGRKFVEADVQICAGDEPYSVNPLYWLATMSDNYTASVELGAQTLDTLDVAAGQCIAGTVAFSVPDTSTPAYVLLTDEVFQEVGRWRAG
jgi:hypothetical protein